MHQTRAEVLLLLRRLCEGDHVLLLRGDAGVVLEESGFGALCREGHLGGLHVLRQGLQQRVILLRSCARGRGSRVRSLGMVDGHIEEHARIIDARCRVGMFPMLLLLELRWQQGVSQGAFIDATAS